MFAVALSILVIGSDPRLRLGAELMTRIENATANTASRIRNSTSRTLFTPQNQGKRFSEFNISPLAWPRPPTFFDDEF